MDAQTLRLLARAAAAIKQFSAAHSAVLNLLLSLSNTRKQALATLRTIHATASGDPTSQLFPIKPPENIEHSKSTFANDLLPLLLKSLAADMHVTVRRVRTDGIEQMQQKVALLRTVAREAMSIASKAVAAAANATTTVTAEHARTPNLPRSIAAAADISTLAEMYERECAVLSFLVQEMHVSLSEDDGDAESADTGVPKGLVDVDAVVERWRDLSLVDLVFEARVMEVARAFTTLAEQEQ